MIERKKVVEGINNCIAVLNELELNEYELITALSQILIYSGHSITNKKIDLKDLSWDALHHLYFTDNSENDIGLGIMLNGATMMEALPEQALNNIKGNEIANQGDSNVDSVSSTAKISQENSSTSTRS